MPLRQASRVWYVPCSTLQHRLTGTQSHRESAYGHQLLSYYQEDCSASFIVNQSSLGLSPILFETRIMVGRLPAMSPLLALLKEYNAYMLFAPITPKFKGVVINSLIPKSFKFVTKAVTRAWFEILELPIIKAIKSGGANSSGISHSWVALEIGAARHRTR